MANDLVFLFDGTWNQAADGNDDQTNVEKLYGLFPDSSIDNLNYEKGVGTRINEEISGGSLGYGIDKRILGAYRFLQSRFERYKGDEASIRIFIFGFSRGAYTARVFAQLLSFSGVPVQGLVERTGWNNYLNQDEEAAQNLKDKGDYFDVEIEVLGVWDTVKSSYHKDQNDDILPSNVKAAYHAMAIDEKRSLFPILRFKSDKRIAEIWFAGVHSDIGGGYPSDESGLSDVTLEWMVNQAKKHNLEFIPDWAEFLAPNLLENMHDSFKGVTSVGEESYREIRIDDDIHESVFKRMAKKDDYKPKNLPARLA
jgi:uncharacterized protein (DUF2235 family)